MQTGRKIFTSTDILGRVCKRTGFSKTFLFHVFFGWFMFCDPFSHSHLFIYLLLYALDSFKLYTNTFNYSVILFNYLFQYFLALLQCSIVFQSLLVSSTHLLFYISEIPIKHSSTLLIWFLHSELFLITKISLFPACVNRIMTH